MPRALVIAAIASIGIKTPVSLLAHMTLTSAVSGVSAASTAAGSISPLSLTGTC